MKQLNSIQIVVTDSLQLGNHSIDLHMASRGHQNGNYHKDINSILDAANAPQAFTSNNKNDNAATDPLMSTAMTIEQFSDLSSNAVINFIGQILLEEDIDDDVSIYQEQTTLQETEKSFYDLLGKDNPPSTKFKNQDTPQENSTANSNFSNTTASVPSYSTPECLLLSATADHISALSMENHGPALVQKGSEEAMKFLPNIDNWFVGLEPKTNNFHQDLKNNGSKKKATYSRIEGQNNNLNEGKQDQSEERNRKQRAVYSDEPERYENLDKFLLSQGNEYVNEVISVQETIKQEMKSKSQKNKTNTTTDMAFGITAIGESSVDLRSLLLRCSEAVSMSNYNYAVELIKQIRKHASPKGEGSQRVAYYLVTALEARLIGTGSDIYHQLVSRQETAIDYLKAYRIYHAACPFMRSSHYFSNQTILNVTKNATKIHIIDFGIQMGFLLPALFERLATLRNTPPKIRITGIEFPQRGFRPNKLVEETGRRLSKYAERFNVRLKYHSISSKWESIKIEDLTIKNDEVLVVNCIYRLENVADETVDMSCPRDKVLRLIREIKPRVFIQGIHNSTYSSPFFTTRFKEVLTRCSSFFDIFESTMPRESEGRLHMEMNLIGPKAINVVACEGSERVDRPETCKQWNARNLRAGFVQLPLDSMIKKNIESSTRKLYHKEFVVAEDNKWLLLGWKGVILFGLSTWMPNEHEIVGNKTI